MYILIFANNPTLYELLQESIHHCVDIFFVQLMSVHQNLKHILFLELLDA